MKKSIIFSLLAAAVFAACDPIEDRDSIGGAITADQLDVTATPIVVDGKNSNKVVLENHSAVLSSWNYGVGVSQKQMDTVLMVVTGTSTIKFTGLNPDGTKITKEIPVEIQALSYPVPPQWGYLCGSGGKNWVWNNDAAACFGNGGWKGCAAPCWWGRTVDQMDEQAAGEGEGASMTFSTDGASLTKHYTNGTADAEGMFSFDMSKGYNDDSGNAWSTGVLTTKNVTVLCGISINEGKIAVNNYDILNLDESHMTLSYHAASVTGSWGEAWFWLFKAE
jgi:hypothetical protein